MGSVKVSRAAARVYERGFATFIVLKCEEEIMWEVIWVVLTAVALLAYALLRARERFVIKTGNPFKGEDLLSFDRNAKGIRLIGFYPDTCPGHKPDLDAGLCYEGCAAGYHGVGPVCWADTTSIGMGMLSGLMSCAESGYDPADGWADAGLICWKTPRAKAPKGNDFFKVWEWKWSGGIGPKKAKCPPGARQQEQAAVARSIAERNTTGTQAQAIRNQKVYNANVYSDAVGGMCYRPCPPDKPNHVPGFPSLCFKNTVGRGLSYTRGEGMIPPLFILGEG